jgi:hypothetical protein
MIALSCAIKRLFVASALVLALPLAAAAWAQATQGTQGTEGTQGTTPTIPASVIESITQAACDPSKLEAAVSAAVKANPTLAGEIATVAVGQCPTDAAGIAASAAAADPAAAAEIVVAVILALPQEQQENNAPQIVAAVEAAVPDSVNQITTAITQLAFNPGAGTGTRGNEGAPLVAPHTDVLPTLH